MANPNNGINGNGGGNGIPNNNNNNGDNNNNNNNNDNNNNNNANGNNGNNNANNHGNNNDNINGNNNGNIYGNNNGNNNANHGNNAIGNNNGNALALGAEARPKPINDDLLRLTNGLDKVPVKRVLDLCSQLGITTAEILATTAKQEAVCGAITRSLAVNEQIIWGVLCERATAVRNSPVKVDMVELSGLLANMTRKYGSPPDASLITSRASILTKMKKIDEALTMDIMELHPNRESKSANRSTINISENNQLVTEEETPKGKARDFSEFSICFMRWAVMLCTIHPMSSNADTCQTSGASLIDLIIYWRRLADLLAPLTMDHLVQYDSDYRRRVAIMIAGESTTLSEALRQDVAPTVLSSALATAAMAAAAATKKNNDSKPTKTQKAPKSNDACYHFLRGSCRRGNSCRFVHDTQEQKRRRSTPAFGQRSEPYDRQSQHEPKSSWSSYASPKDSPSSAEASRKAKNTGPGKSHSWPCDELREREPDAPAGFQDGTGISAELPADDATHPPKAVSDHEAKAFYIINRITQKWRLAEELSTSLSPSGAIRAECIDRINLLFIDASNDLRRELTEAFPGYGAETARVGGPLYPGIIRLLSTIFDEGRDPTLADELNSGVHLGALTTLSVSGVFPPKDTQKPREEFAPCRSPHYENYVSARDAKQAVEEAIQAEVRAGKIRELAPHQLRTPGRLFSKLAAIPKRLDASGNPTAYRLVEDLKRSGTNQLIDLHESVQLPSAGDLKQLAQNLIFDDTGALKDYVGAVTDFEGAYRHLFICPEERHLCSLKLNNKYYENLAMPFGAPSSCWNFCRLSSKSHRIQHRLGEISRILTGQSESSRGLIYIDDAIWLLPVAGYFTLLVKLLVVLPLIGLQISWRKCIYGSKSLRFIGYSIDIGTGARQGPHISIPPGKLEKIKSELAALQAQGATGAWVKDIERLSGRLNWISMVCPFTRSFISPLYAICQMACKKGLHKVQFSKSSETHKCLSWWASIVDEAILPMNPFRLALPLAPTAIQDRVRIATDASTIGIGGWASYRGRVLWFKVDLTNVDNLHGWRQFLVNKSSPQSGDMVLLETMAGVIGITAALDGFEEGISDRTCFSFFTDNAGTKRALTKFRSPTPRINAILMATVSRLARVCYRWHAEYIPSAENKAADIISREANPAPFLPKHWIRLKCHLPPALPACL